MKCARKVFQKITKVFFQTRHLSSRIREAGDYFITFEQQKLSSTIYDYSRTLSRH